MSPEDVVVQAIHDVWQPLDEGRTEVFPSRSAQARFILAALHAAGFSVVEVRADEVRRLVASLRSRNQGRPTWSYDYDPAAASAADFLSTMVKESLSCTQVSDAQ